MDSGKFIYKTRVSFCGAPHDVDAHSIHLS